MPRKTDSSNPADWLYIAREDLRGVDTLAAAEISYGLCRSKLAEIIEKLLKAELIRLGWYLEKTHDLRKLLGELQHRKSVFCDALGPLVVEYSEVYFMHRYPGFDLEDADWLAFRTHAAEARQILDAMDAKTEE